MYSSKIYVIIYFVNHSIFLHTSLSDFELALLSAVKLHFPTAPIIGCLFHFLQSLRRRLEKIHNIPDNIARVLLGDQAGGGLIKLLTIIPTDEILTKGIPYIQEKLAEVISIAGYEKPMTDFWKYFEGAWMDTYPPTLWNIQAITDSSCLDTSGTVGDLINRTNNPCKYECYVV